MVPAQPQSANGTTATTLTYDALVQKDERADTLPLYRCSVVETPNGYLKIQAAVRPSGLKSLLKYDPEDAHRAALSPTGSLFFPVGLAEQFARVERTLIKSKIEIMVEYLARALDGKDIADWGPIDLVTSAEPNTSSFPASGDIHMPSAAQYLITDGQHRCVAIFRLLAKYPDIADNFTQAISITVVPKDKLLNYCAQVFHDKNYLMTTVATTKALDSDMRDPHNKLTRELLAHPVIIAAGGVDRSKLSLKSTDPKFATHAVLFKFVRAFADGRAGLDKAALNAPELTDSSFASIKAELWGYVTDLGECMPHWKVDAPNREAYLNRASAALQALGVIGWHLRKLGDAGARRAAVSKLGEAAINWERSNLDWHTVIGQVQENKGVVPASSRQAIDKTISFLRERMGVTSA